MSKEIYSNRWGTIVLTSYCGPMNTDTESQTRMRLQLNAHDKYDTLSYEQAVELHKAIGVWLEEHRTPTRPAR